MKHLTDKIQNHRTTPNPLVWDKIESSLEVEGLKKQQSLYRRLMYAAAAIVLILSATFLLIQNQSQSTYTTNPLAIATQQMEDPQLMVSQLNNIHEVKFQNKKGKLIPNYRVLSKKPLVVNLP